MKNFDVIAVIPAFNEENHISEVIQLLNRFFTKDQILVANDGSTDNTLSIAQTYGVRSVSIQENQGKGFILRKAFQVILSEMPNVKWIITIDADGQHNHKNIPQFLSISKSHPKIGIFVGHREYSMMPYINRISNLLTSRWCKYWLKWDIDDLQCGFRSYDVQSLRKIMKFGLTCRKFDLETEILLVAWFLGIGLGQIPISTHYAEKRRRSRITPTTDTLRWIRLVTRSGFNSTFFRKMWHNM